ncbi:MAG: hypothetical protein AAB384_03100 [Patescibacteria group bacterium]
MAAFGMLSRCSAGCPLQHEESAMICNGKGGGSGGHGGGNGGSGGQSGGKGGSTGGTTGTRGK